MQTFISEGLLRTLRIERIVHPAQIATKVIRELNITQKPGPCMAHKIDPSPKEYKF